MTDTHHLWLLKCDPVSTDSIIYRNNQEVAWLGSNAKGRADRGESLTTTIIVTFLIFATCWLWKGHSSGGPFASVLGWPLVRHFLLLLFFFPFSNFKLMSEPRWWNSVQVKVPQKVWWYWPQTAGKVLFSARGRTGSRAIAHLSKRYWLHVLLLELVIFS